MKATFTMAVPLMTTPAMVVVTPNSPTTQPASKERIAFCEICSAVGRPCPLYTLPAPTVSVPHPDWSNVEEDWDGKGQKEEEGKRNRK